ncbi:unnamed protein product [Calypogeia fissa]
MGARESALRTRSLSRGYWVLIKKNIPSTEAPSLDRQLLRARQKNYLSFGVKVPYGNGLRILFLLLLMTDIVEDKGVTLLEYSKHFEAEPREVAGNGKVFGHANGLSWLPPSQSMAVKQPERVPESHIKHHPMAAAAVADSNAEMEQQREGEEEEELGAIPMLDMAQLEAGGTSAEEFKRQIATACKEWGFFQVVNHGVEQTLIEDYMRLVRNFFSLSFEEKAEFVGSNFNAPALYATRTNDWSDFLRLKCEPVTDPDISRWPEKPVGFREMAAEYARKVTAFARRLLAVLSENLGLRKEYLNEAFQAHAFTYINNNFYPVCPEPGLTLGLSGHSDPGGITILYQDDVGGLQAQKAGGPWVDITPTRNAFVVNLADQLQILSNGIYRSGMHRVVVNSKQPRYSAAAIFSPDAAAKIAPAQELLGNGLQARRYPEISFADYMVGYVTNGAYEKGFLNSLLLPNVPSHSTAEDECA